MFHGFLLSSGDSVLFVYFPDLFRDSRASPILERALEDYTNEEERGFRIPGVWVG